MDFKDPKTTWSIAVVGLLVIAIIVLVPSSGSDPSKDNISPSGAIIPDQFAHYTGEIVEVSEDRLVIEARAEDNYLTKNQRVTIFLDQNTEFAVLVLRSGVSSREERLVDQEYFTSIAGGKITAYAAENVKSKDKYTAVRVETEIIE